MAADSVPGSSNSGFANQTVRHITHVSVAGNQLRVRLSNAYGTGPLNIGATTLHCRARERRRTGVRPRAYIQWEPLYHYPGRCIGVE